MFPPGAQGWGTERNRLHKRHREDFRGDVCIHYLDCDGGGFTSVQICQNSSS